MIAVIARLKVKKNKIDEAMAHFKKLIAKVDKEEGTLSYTVNRDRSDPTTLVVIERYKDDDAFAAHSTTPYLAEFFAAVKDCMEGRPELVLLDEIASIEKGA